MQSTHSLLIQNLVQPSNFVSPDNLTFSNGLLRLSAHWSQNHWTSSRQQKRKRWAHGPITFSHKPRKKSNYIVSLLLFMHHKQFRHGTVTMWQLARWNGTRLGGHATQSTFSILTNRSRVEWRWLSSRRHAYRKCVVIAVVTPLRRFGITVMYSTKRMLWYRRVLMNLYGGWMLCSCDIWLPST